MSPSARQIEREVEATRANLEETVEALKDKMSLGQIVDEAARYFDDTGGSRLVSNLGAQVRDNPLPLLLVGVGLAWLISGRGQPHMRSRYAYGAGSEGTFTPFYPRPEGEFAGMEVYGDGSTAVRREAMSERAARAARGVGDAVTGAAGAVASGVGAVASAIGSAAEAAGSAASTAGDAVAASAHGVRHAGDAAWRGGSAAYDQASRVGSTAYGGVSHLSDQARRGFASLLEAEPLVLGALGLAVGAAIGAMLPSTETEDRLLGEKRDQLSEEASALAREKYEQGKTVVEEAYRTARKEVEAEGLAPKGEGGLIERVGRVARGTVEKARKAAAEEGLMATDEPSSGERTAAG